MTEKKGLFATAGNVSGGLLPVLEFLGDGGKVKEKEIEELLRKIWKG